MSKLPAFQFYPGDWLKDPELSRCSAAARGVWIDLLCLMFGCEERGVLSTGGCPWSDLEIAAAVRGDTQEVLSCLRELIGKGVAHRNDSGAVYSRRLVRDEELRRRANDRLKRFRNANETPLKHPSSSSVSSSSSTSSSTSNSTSTSKPTPGSKAFAQNQGARELPGFELFWQAYPKRVGKPLARRAWLSKVGDDDKHREVIAGLELWKKCAQWQDPQFVPYPATFLNQMRWQDEVPKGGKTNGRKSTEELVRDNLIGTGLFPRD